MQQPPLAPATCVMAVPVCSKVQPVGGELMLVMVDIINLLCKGGHGLSWTKAEVSIKK